MKVWKQEEIVTLLEKSDEMVRRSLIKLYEQQTLTEQNSEQTIEHNKVGFSAFDAEFLTSLVHQLLKKKYLSPRQIGVARKKLMKYSKQLTTLSNIEYTKSLTAMKQQLAFKGV